MEYLYFLNYIFAIVKYRKNVSYHSFKINEIPNNLSSFEVWIKICELNAFKKIYTIALKKKLNPKSFIIVSIIIVLGVPLRLIKICSFILKRKNSLKDSLIEYFYFEFASVKGRKIEIVNNKVYVNCSTRVDILRKLISMYPHKTHQELAFFYKGLIEVNQKFANSYQKIATLQVPFHLARLKTEEGFMIKKNHWSNQTDHSIRGESQRSVIHATSNVPEALSKSQISSIFMSDLKQPGSKNPGSIITSGDFKIDRISETPKYVWKWQLENVYYDVYGLDHKSIYNSLFENKKAAIDEYLNVKNTQLCKQILSGSYEQVLNLDRSAGVNEIYEELKNIK